MSLFDLTPYGGPAREPTQRTKAAPPETVEVRGERWNGISKTTIGIVHYVLGERTEKQGGGIVSMCGVLVVPHTYADDEVRPGCVRCAREVNYGRRVQGG